MTNWQTSNSWINTYQMQQMLEWQTDKHSTAEVTQIGCNKRCNDKHCNNKPTNVQRLKRHISDATNVAMTNVAATNQQTNKRPTAKATYIRCDKRCNDKHCNNKPTNVQQLIWCEKTLKRSAGTSTSYGIPLQKQLYFCMLKNYALGIGFCYFL